MLSYMFFYKYFNFSFLTKAVFLLNLTPLNYITLRSNFIVFIQIINPAPFIKQSILYSLTSKSPLP